jgi:hypothetical protein
VSTTVDSKLYIAGGLRTKASEFPNSPTRSAKDKDTRTYCGYCSHTISEPASGYKPIQKCRTVDDADSLLIKQWEKRSHPSLLNSDSFVTFLDLTLFYSVLLAIKAHKTRKRETEDPQTSIHRKNKRYHYNYIRRLKHALSTPQALPQALLKHSSSQAR